MPLLLQSLMTDFELDLCHCQSTIWQMHLILNPHIKYLLLVPKQPFVDSSSLLWNVICHMGKKEFLPSHHIILLRKIGSKLRGAYYLTCSSKRTGEGGVLQEAVVKLKHCWKFAQHENCQYRNFKQHAQNEIPVQKEYQADGFLYS